MPLYEYRCKECSNIIEFRSSMDKKEEMVNSLKCKNCGSTNFAQVFGGVALTGIKNDNSDQNLPPGGSCCPGGACGL